MLGLRATLTARLAEQPSYMGGDEPGRLDHRYDVSAGVPHKAHDVAPGEDQYQVLAEHNVAHVEISPPHDDCRLEICQKVEQRLPCRRHGRALDDVDTQECIGRLALGPPEGVESRWLRRVRPPRLEQFPPGQFVTLELEAA